VLVIFVCCCLCGVRHYRQKQGYAVITAGIDTMSEASDFGVDPSAPPGKRWDPSTP